MFQNHENFVTLDWLIMKLHTCPIGLWCENCALCEFDYDNLKRKLEIATEPKDQNDLNLILKEKIKTATKKLESKSNSVKTLFIFN